MSGVIGHVTYAVLGARAAADRQLPLVNRIERHGSSYLCGADLGCDIQTLPEAVCVDTGQPVGYGTVPIQASSLTGGPVRPGTLQHEGRRYRPTELHRLRYGRTHLLFGWSGVERMHTVPWDHLADYGAAVFAMR